MLELITYIFLFFLKKGGVCIEHGGGWGMSQHNSQYFTFTWFLLWSHLLTHLLPLFFYPILSDVKHLIFKLLFSSQSEMIIGYHIASVLQLDKGATYECRRGAVFFSLHCICFSQEDRSVICSSWFDSFSFRFIEWSDLRLFDRSVSCQMQHLFRFIEILMQKKKQYSFYWSFCGVFHKFGAGVFLLVL